MTDVNKSINWYPNPVQNILNIETQNSAKIQNINVYNLLGQKIISRNLNSESIVTVDMSHLQPGTYMLEIISNTAKTTTKIIKI
jgi:hypothetical protein